MTKLREMAEKIAASLDCTWNGEQGRWVSEGLIETALRSVAEECIKVADSYGENPLTESVPGVLSFTSGCEDTADCIVDAIKTRFGLGGE